VSSPADRENLLAAALEGLGRLDALVNNAGMAPAVRTDVLEATEASLDELLAVNLKGPYFLSQLAARHFLAHRGEARLPGGYKVVFVSSMSAHTVSVTRGDYCVSKAGLAMAAQVFAARLAGEGVQVYEVRPGIMATDMTAGVKEKYDRLIAEGLVPQGRWGTPEDVGLAVGALLLGEFPFSTGAVVPVDGGAHLRRL
jgi:NAD(P)-dependent dehydrogenase (short-subunit alcohol dehydrogenase family)